MTEDHSIDLLVYCCSASHPFSDEKLGDLLTMSR